MHKTIHDLSLPKGTNKNIVNFIEILKFICNEINAYFKVNTKRNKVEEFIKKLEENKTRNNISCRKLSTSYFEWTGDKISKAYIHNLLKNNFNLSYLKSTVKSINLNTPSDVFMLCFF